jgi:hypothetical protein
MTQIKKILIFVIRVHLRPINAFVVPPAYAGGSA